MARRGVWALGTNYDAGDIVEDLMANEFITTEAHTATEDNRPIPTGAPVNADQVRDIIRETFVEGSDPVATGIRMEYDATDNRVIATATRNVSFTDISNAIAAYLEGREEGQYYFVINKE